MNIIDLHPALNEHIHLSFIPDVPTTPRLRRVPLGPLEGWIITGALEPIVYVNDENQKLKYANINVDLNPSREKQRKKGTNQIHQAMIYMISVPPTINFIRNHVSQVSGQIVIVIIRKRVVAVDKANVNTMKQKINTDLRSMHLSFWPGARHTHFYLLVTP